MSTSHINTIAAKAHATAGVIHKCFLSKEATTQTKAYEVCICYGRHTI